MGEVIEDPVVVPRGLLGAASYAIANKADAPKTMAALRRYAFQERNARAVVPENCRQQLMAEGKAFPRSSCAACGRFAPKWRECDAALEANAAPGEYVQACGERPNDGYPPCDYCGCHVDYMPWHGSGLINGVESRHIHACDNCRGRLPSGNPDAVKVRREQLDELEEFLTDALTAADLVRRGGRSKALADRIRVRFSRVSKLHALLGKDGEA